MRSRSEAKLRLLCVAAASGILLSAPVLAVRDGEPPSEAQVTAAVAQLKNDPNVAGAHKIRSLHWISTPRQPQPGDLPDWLRVIGRFFAWLAEAGRYAVWAACAVLVGVLAVFLLRVLQRRWQQPVIPAVTLPTYVRDLDIRPESLPDDIGAASRELWERGEHRAALALLYRGCLSRLVHAHGVPIRDSTTEGECVQLAARYLRSADADYVSRLVRVWQRAVYRGEDASRDVVFTLCESFSAALDPPTPALNAEGVPA